jgi:hypothetical protein
MSHHFPTITAVFLRLLAVFFKIPFANDRLAWHAMSRLTLLKSPSPPVTAGQRGFLLGMALLSTSSISFAMRVHIVCWV